MGNISGLYVQLIWLYSTMQVQLLLMTIGIFLYESDLNVWVHMRQAARTVPIAGTAWGRALLASCLHMLAADIPGNPKKISDNLQYTAYFKSRPQVPVQTVFHYLPQVDYIRNSFLKGNLFIFFIEFWRVFKLMYSFIHARFI